MKQILEAHYPPTFRKEDAKYLGTLLGNRHSVAVVGMKRVGINNFLRFFLYHPDTLPTYLKGETKHLFVRIDLNDLIERDIYPFWTLTLKRIVDTVEKTNCSETLKKECRKLFTESIQIKDLFFTLDSVHKIIGKLVNEGISPTLFLLRFDRLNNVISHEFFHNLQGLNESANHKLSYVFTSFRPLHQVAPEVLKKSSLSGFCDTLYIKPTQNNDSGILLETFETHYGMKLQEPIKRLLIELSGGHAQYLQQSLIKLQSIQDIPQDREVLLTLLGADEQIALQSEELLASLTPEERTVLLAVHQSGSATEQQKKTVGYLWDTGILVEKGKKEIIFSPLFAHYVSSIATNAIQGSEFTRKEHVLFSFLKTNQENLCERDAIINAVWPEQAEFGISDWAVDRLIARVRSKLKAQKSLYEIVTVITRGYKLVKKG